MFYFQTNALGFTPEFLGRVRLAGSLASLAGMRLSTQMLLTCLLIILQAGLAASLPQSTPGSSSLYYMTEGCVMICKNGQWKGILWSKKKGICSAPEQVQRQISYVHRNLSIAASGCPVMLCKLMPLLACYTMLAHIVYTDIKGETEAMD